MSVQERTAAAPVQGAVDRAEPRRRPRPSLGWVLRPAATTAVNILVVIVLAFVLVQLIPGDPIVAATGGRLSPEELAAARASYGLDDPLWSQFGAYLLQLAQFDLGSSIATGRSVAGEFAVRIPATLELVISGVLAASIATLLLSHLVVTRPGSRLSRALTAYARSAGALPEYVLGIAFLFVFYAVLQWAPAPAGRLDPLLNAPPQVTGFPVLDALIDGDGIAAASYIEHLVLPVLVMMVAHTPILMKTLILSLDEAIDDPATKFRIASGAPRGAVLASIYRRALPQGVAMLGMLFGLLLGGAVVLEALFGLGGLGQYAVDAVDNSDVFALRSFLVVSATLCLLIYLLVDLATGLLDPRRRLSRKAAA